MPRPSEGGITSPVAHRHPHRPVRAYGSWRELRTLDQRLAMPGWRWCFTTLLPLAAPAWGIDRPLWVAHAVHHQSQDYNQHRRCARPVQRRAVGWIFYVPMVAGPAAAAGVWGWWRSSTCSTSSGHTEQVANPGWFDWLVLQPQQPPVHLAAVNDAYLDRNYGGILHPVGPMFGTFGDEEDENVCTAPRACLNNSQPANAEVYADWRRQLACAQLASTVKRLAGFPGWRPADGRSGSLACPMAAFGTYHPPTSRHARRAVVCAGAVCAVALLAAFCGRPMQCMSGPTPSGFAVLLTAGLQWSRGAACQGRFMLLMALMVEARRIRPPPPARWGSDGIWCLPLTKRNRYYLL